MWQVLFAFSHEFVFVNTKSAVLYWGKLGLADRVKALRVTGNQALSICLTEVMA